MTEKKQITIYELLPLLKPGWVVMDSDNRWWYYASRPAKTRWGWTSDDPRLGCLANLFTVAPFDGDWKDSLMEVK